MRIQSRLFSVLLVVCFIYILTLNLINQQVAGPSSQDPHPPRDEVQHLGFSMGEDVLVYHHSVKNLQGFQRKVYRSSLDQHQNGKNSKRLTNKNIDTQLVQNSLTAVKSKRQALKDSEPQKVGLAFKLDHIDFGKKDTAPSRHNMEILHASNARNIFNNNMDVERTKAKMKHKSVRQKRFKKYSNIDHINDRNISHAHNDSNTNDSYRGYKRDYRGVDVKREESMRIAEDEIKHSNTLRAMRLNNNRTSTIAEHDRHINNRHERRAVQLVGGRVAMEIKDDVRNELVRHVTFQVNNAAGNTYGRHVNSHSNHSEVNATQRRVASQHAQDRKTGRMRASPDFADVAMEHPNMKNGYPSPYWVPDVKKLSESSGPRLAFEMHNNIHHPMEYADSLVQQSPNFLYPDQNTHDDRILQQLSLVPSKTQTYSDPDSVLHDNLKDFKVILTFSGSGGLPAGQEKFQNDKCPINSCYLTWDVRWAQKADAVVFNFDPGPDTWEKPPHQVWLLFLLESPVNTPFLYDLKDKVNWTASYRLDSTIVAPYEKYVPYHIANTINTTFQWTFNPFHSLQNSDYAKGKTNLVAWFVSNCNARNKRMSYVHELQKHIQVDIYGACGPNKCSKKDEETCLQLLQQHYKFYLAFENSNCQYYITEKFFTNALKSGVVPVVMGARREDYEAVAPPHSFIHVEDFASPADLASFLIHLDSDDARYNEYFQWRETGGFIDTKFWCRLCALLHQDDLPHTWYSDIEKWWRANATCTHDHWDNTNDLISQWKGLVF